MSGGLGCLEPSLQPATRCRRLGYIMKHSIIQVFERVSVKIWSRKLQKAVGTPNAVTPNSRRTHTNLRPSLRTKFATCCDGCPFHLIPALFLFQLMRFPFSLCAFLLKPLRLFVAMCCAYLSPQGYTVLYTVIRYPVFQLIRLFVSIRLTQLCTQAYALAYVQPRSSNSSSFSLTSCIRPQRLYSPALRPSLLDRTDTIQDSIRHSHMHIVSRSQGLPKNLDRLATANRAYDSLDDTIAFYKFRIAPSSVSTGQTTSFQASEIVLGQYRPDG